MDEVKENVQEYYGRTLNSSSEVRTCKSCMREDPSGLARRSVIAAIRSVHADIQDTYYGCGLVIPSIVSGMRIVDLGSGAGRDCFAMSKLVGPNGYITGIDMTEELLQTARKYVTFHQEAFGYNRPNVEFRKGLIENLKDAGIEDGGTDFVISNCVLSLSSNKPAALREAYRILKDGGEFYFSDVYVRQEIPQHIKENKVLLGEGMATALHWQEMVRLAQEIGFATPRVVSCQIMDIEDEDLRKIVGDVVYVSATYRLFKIPMQSCAKEAIVTYTGSLLEYEESLPFDKEHTFLKNDPVRVDGELAAILSASRYKTHFSCSDCEENCSSKVSTHCPVNPYAYIEETQACCP